MSAGETPQPEIDAQQRRLSFARVLQQPLESLPNPIPMLPLGIPFSVELAPPGSKSLTNRALLLAALADGVSTLRRPLIGAEDVERMSTALGSLGVEVDARGELPGERVEPAMRVRGGGGALQGTTQVDLANAGTATRFLAAAALHADGPVTIDGGPRMRERPIGELAAALRALGAEVEHLAGTECPPIRITPPDRASMGSEVAFGTTASSQFISALLLIAPWTPHGIRITIDGEVTSTPYIAMTLELLRVLGAKNVSASTDMRELFVGHGPISAFDILIEPDASGASYFWAAAAMGRESACRITGLSRESLQGDARFPSVLAAMGAVTGESEGRLGVASPPASRGGLSGVRVDLSTMPDTAMTLAVAACFANKPTTISGLRTLRVKETDRIEAIRRELAKLGAHCDITEDERDLSITISPPVSSSEEAIEFDTYDDHRMAMSLALIGLYRPNVSIRDPGCVRKTYPTFWSDLARLYAC